MYFSTYVYIFKFPQTIQSSAFMFIYKMVHVCTWCSCKWLIYYLDLAHSFLLLHDILLILFCDIVYFKCFMFIMIYCWFEVQKCGSMWTLNSFHLVFLIVFNSLKVTWNIDANYFALFSQVRIVILFRSTLGVARLHQ